MSHFLPVRLPLAIVIVSVAITLFHTPISSAQPPGFTAPSGEVGLKVNEAQAFPGYSLLAPMNSTSTYLIDMQGRVVNRWDSEYRPALSAYLLEDGHLLRSASQPGAIFGAGAGGRIQKFSWDGELVWDFALATEQYHPHHDICPMPNGHVLVIAWDRKSREEAIAAGRHPDTVQGQFLPDCILEIQPTGKTDGKIVWEWHAWDHLIQDLDPDKPNYGEISEHPERIDINFGSGLIAAMLSDPEELAKLRALGYVGGGTARPGRKAPPGDGPRQDRPGSDRNRSDRGGPAGAGPGAGGPGGGPPMQPDWMHTNSVAYHPELDQIMLSIHEFSEVWIIDHSTTTRQAASSKGGRYGKGGDLLFRWGNPRAYRNGTQADQRLFAQHNAHWIPDGLPGAGHMLVFNNGNGRPGGMYSSVDEVVLPMESDGSYAREEFLAFGPESADWSYAGTESDRFFSMTISGAQRLPNGNTLICSGNAATLIEVTADQEVVWKYVAPQGGGFPGGPMAGFQPPRPGEVLPAILQGMLELSPEQKDRLASLQKRVDDELADLLTAEQKSKLEQLQRGFAGGMGFGPPGFGPPGFGGGPGFGPPGFGPPLAGGPGFGPPGRDGQTRDARRGGPGMGGPGMGGPGGPGGLFTCHRYGADYLGLADKDLTPGEKLEDVLKNE